MLALYIRIRNYFDDESGQTAVEYTLLLALIALAIVSATPSVATAISGVWSRITTALSPAAT